MVSRHFEVMLTEGELPKLTNRSVSTISAIILADIGCFHAHQSLFLTFSSQLVPTTFQGVNHAGLHIIIFRDGNGTHTEDSSSVTDQ